MAFNLQNIAKKLLGSCNPDPNKAGNILLAINALGMVFAALSNTYAAAVDKNTSAEDKKFLVPAGLVTGVANIGLYYTMTTGIIEGLKKSADKAIEAMKPEDLAKKSLELVDRKIAKAKSPEIADSLKKLFKNQDGSINDAAKKLYKDNNKAAAGVLGAFVGAVVGCAVLTPIIRDVSAYFVQKRMEKNNPEMADKPYKPYFEPTRIESVRYGNITEQPKRQPLSMKSYMAFTNSGSMKI